MDKIEKVKMVFHEDKHVDGEIFAEKDKPVMVDRVSVDRWRKRGGQVVSEMEAEESVKPGDDESKDEDTDEVKLAKETAKKTPKVYGSKNK